MLVRLHRELGFEGPVLTLGNQDIWANHDDLLAIFREQGCTPHSTEVLPHTSSLLNKFLPERSRDFVHARTFFGMMGLDGYVDLDCSAHDQPQILQDLNQPIPDDLAERFGLILDGGTVEHILDVRQGISNVQRMCKVGGWVIHLSPLSSCPDFDHGYLYPSPMLFHDVYAANGFDQFHCTILQFNTRYPLRKCPLIPYRYGEMFGNLVYPERCLLTLFAARKVQASGPFVVPSQGGFGGQREEPASAAPAWEPLRKRWGNAAVLQPLRHAYHGLQRLQLERA